MERIGVLVPALSRAPGVPEDQPIGRAALRLAADGIEVVFGSEAHDGVLRGTVARPGRYEPAAHRVVAALDRFPSQSRPAAFERLRTGLAHTPIANPPALTLLCRDKLATQRVLEGAGLPIPEVQTDPERFQATLADWGVAFLKPQHGAFGRGISRVVPGDPLPATGPGSVPGVPEPLFLQRAVVPPEGHGGIACRVLVQREPGGWWVGPPVARRSAHDPVVNASRGASVHPLSELVPDAVHPVRALARAAAEALAAEPGGDWLVELGVDVVIGAHELALLEVNSKPRGRLEALAGQDPEAWAEAHIEACARPLRALLG